MKIDVVDVVIVYCTVFAALLFDSFITTNSAHAEEINREKLISRIKILDSVNKKNNLILKEQEKILSGQKDARALASHNRLAAYESPPGNCTAPTLTTSAIKENTYTYLSYSALGLASIPAVIGPVVEAYRHYHMYGVNNEQVLKSALLWPIASTLGNGLFLAHVVTNQEENVVQKYANAIPTVFVMIASQVTMWTLIRYGRKNGFRGRR